MENTARSFEGGTQQKRAKGWGADLDPKNRPGIPKEKNTKSIKSAEFPDIPKQPVNIKVLMTPERSEITPVFGTTCPPAGVSGKMRELAFLYSEDKIRHWMLLLFADRVNMVEGWFADIAQGKKPMILPRMEFRTLDHARRAIKQGPKCRDDYVALAAVGLVFAGIGAAGYFLTKGLPKASRPYTYT